MGARGSEEIGRVRSEVLSHDGDHATDLGSGHSGLSAGGTGQGGSRRESGDHPTYGEAAGAGRSVESALDSHLLREVSGNEDDPRSFGARLSAIAQYGRDRDDRGSRQRLLRHERELRTDRAPDDHSILRPRSADVRDRLSGQSTDLEVRVQETRGDIVRCRPSSIRSAGVISSDLPACPPRRCSANHRRQESTWRPG